MVLNQDRGLWAVPGDVSDGDNGGRYWYQVSEGQDAIEYPTMNRTLAHNKRR